MASVASPYGLRPVQLLGGLPFAGAIRSFSLAANIPANKGIFFGDPVGLSAGQLTVLGASPTTTITADSPIGVFMGAEWQDPIRGFVNSQFVPANLITGGASQVKFKILDCPTAVFKVQHTGSVPYSAIGMNVALTAASLGVGNTATGDSIVSVTGAPAVTATLALKIIGFVNAPGSAPGDPFTDLLVIWNQGVQRWAAAASF
jgi:hypothetical protein